MLTDRRIRSLVTGRTACRDYPVCDRSIARPTCWHTVLMRLRSCGCAGVGGRRAFRRGGGGDGL